MDLFSPLELDNDRRKRNLDVKASGIVTSTKYFPVFEVGGCEKIFKPLSKTKPLSTPLFSYSEVYWSYLINKFVDDATPVYQLAYCHNLSKEQPKYYDKGCLVDNVLKDGEKMVNLLELFRMYPSTNVDIDNYVNYCELQYDYTHILKSAFFHDNHLLAKKLAEQILCSILRRDENYHYENVSLIFKNGKPIRVAPIIDSEFSLMFMYPDLEEQHKYRFSSYDEGMQPLFTYDESMSYEENLENFKKRVMNGSIYDYFDQYKNHLTMKNLVTIVSSYPDVVRDFLVKIQNMKREVENLNIDFDQKFLGRFSSLDWQPTRMLFKEGKIKTDPEYREAEAEAEKSRMTLDSDKFNKSLKREVIWSIDKMTDTINVLFDLDQNDIKSYQNKTLYGKIKRLPEDLMQLIYENTIVEGQKEKTKKKEILS